MSATSAVPRPATVAGRRIDAVEHPGDPARRPIVLLHEGLGSVGLWREFPAALALATGRRVLVFSRFGHGRSEPPPEPRTPAFFHEEALDVLPALLPQLDAAGPILVGHSDGASIALIHAAYHPVTGLALIAPHAFVEDFTVEEIARTRDLFEDGGLRERMARHHDDPDAAFHGLERRVARPRVPRVEHRVRRASGVTAPDAADPGRAPTPTARSTRSTASGQRIQGPVERLVVDGAGHSPMFEAPEAVPPARSPRSATAFPDPRLAPAAGLDELGQPDELDARAAVRLARPRLVLVDRLPAVPRRRRPGARVAQPGARSPRRRRRAGLVQPPGLGVLDDPRDGVGRVLLVRADDAARAALDPADDVLAGQRLAVLVADAAARRCGSGRGARRTGCRRSGRPR